MNNPEDVQVALQQLYKKRDYARDYRKKYVVENREKVNQQQRERYARKKAERIQKEDSPKTT